MQWIRGVWLVCWVVMSSVFVAGSLVSAAEPVRDAKTDEVLAKILGSPVNQWQISRRNGTADDFVVKEVDGHSVLAAGPNATLLTTQQPILADSEISVRFRFDQAPKRVIWFWLTCGLPDLVHNGENMFKLSLATPEGENVDYFHWTLAALPGQKQGAYSTYSARGLAVSRDGWPDLIRLRVEREFAESPPLNKRWLTVKYIVRKQSTAAGKSVGSCRVLLDDRVLRDAKGEGLDPFGLLKFTLFDGVQLESIRIKPLPPEDARFEIVELGNDLNTNQFGGAAVNRDSLPKPEEKVEINGVPFTFAAPDEKGRTHIDVQSSWLKCGALEGQFDGWEGEPARWKGALHRDPGRIRFRVRNAKYTALHLLAIAEGRPDHTQQLGVQFYRPNAGFPLNFNSRVFRLEEPHRKQIWRGEPVNLGPPDARRPSMFHVTIDLNAGSHDTHASGGGPHFGPPDQSDGLGNFSDLDHLEFELTKQLSVYRSYPDPIYYSVHGAGLPSDVHVFAMTLERPLIDLSLEHNSLAHVWTAPDKPKYLAVLKNLTERKAHVVLGQGFVTAGSFQSRGGEVHETIPPLGTKRVELSTDPKTFGIHRVLVHAMYSPLELTGKGGLTETVGTEVDWSFAYLHPDTRERGNWEEGRGPIFGFWDWGGGHTTPGGLDRLRVMAACGAESINRSFHHPGHQGDMFSADEKAYAEKMGFVSFFNTYQLSMGKHSLGVDWDPSKPKEMEAALIEKLKQDPITRPSKINRPDLNVFFAEPVLGDVSYRSLPQFYGEGAEKSADGKRLIVAGHEMTEAELAAYKNFHDQFVTAGRALKREWPQSKNLFPWGLPMFPIPFLLHSPEARELMDGPALDVVLFERLPEMQLHQVTLSAQMWQLKQIWEQVGKPWPKLATVEGPCSSPPLAGALTEQQEADHTIRAFLILSAYGTTRHLGWPTPFECASAWGESHYGSGMIRRQPDLSPKLLYSAYATLTRQLNRRNFVKAVPTGSHTVFGQQYQHFKTGERLHVFWTLRGNRPVTLTVPADAAIRVFDSQDNATDLTVNDGKVTFSIGTSPCYVHGLTADPQITLGKPDHSDASSRRLAWSTHTHLANLGDGTWTASTDRDRDYEESHPLFVRRFSLPMKVATVEAKDRPWMNPQRDAPGMALSVHLDPPAELRRTMPFYTTLVPKQPIVIGGQATHLGLWVKAASDWGRVVYVLRDANGEKWISVGKRGEWNCDDVHCHSQFCFDGWRYLRFEMPANAPYDLFREAGSTWWGSYGAKEGGQADNIVDLPLLLEKIIVERRTHVIAGTELLAANPADVLFNELFAEYEHDHPPPPGDAVRLSKLRMPP